MSYEQTEDKWEDMYRQGLGAPKYPNGDALRWLFGNFPRTRAADFHLLDMGCGVGRHAVMMAREGFKVTATDYARTAIDQAAKWAESAGLDINFFQTPAESQPFPDGSFDGILCYGVLYYLSPAKFSCAVGEIHRLLKKGGKTFVMVKNDRDVRSSKGVEIAPYQFAVTGEDEGMPWNNEQDMRLSLLPKSEIITYFSIFSDLRIEEITSTLGGGKYLEAAWLIYGRK